MSELIKNTGRTLLSCNYCIIVIRCAFLTILALMQLLLQKFKSWFFFCSVDLIQFFKKTFLIKVRWKLFLSLYLGSKKIGLQMGNEYVYSKNSVHFFPNCILILQISYILTDLDLGSYFNVQRNNVFWLLWYILYNKVGWI